MKERSAGVRKRLLDAAERLFNYRGIHGIGIEAIATEAGAAKMSLYHEFGSKLNLLLAVLDRLDERWVRQIRACGHSPNTDGEQAVLALFDRLEEWFREPEFQGCMFIKAAGDFGNANHAVRRAALKHQERIQALIEEICVKAGYEDPILARQVYLLIQGAIVTAMIEGTPAAANQAKEAARSLLHGCRGYAGATGTCKKLAMN